jgi:O-antigen/teichoic acid export membrane protein
VHSIIFGQASAIATSLLLIQKKFPRRYSKGKLDENLSEFKNYLSMYGVSFVLLSVVNWATNMTDRYVLAWMAGPALTGTYIAAFALGSRAITLCNSFTTDIFRPQVFALAVDGSISKLSRPLLFWFGCNLTLCCATLWIIFVFGDQLLDLFLAKSFMQDTKTIILWIGLGYFLYGLNQILEVCIFALNKPNKLLFPMISGTIVTAYFSVLLIPDYGIIGSAISSTTGFAVQLFATAAQLARFLMERRRT